MYAVPEMDVLSSAAFYMLVFLEMPAYSIYLFLRKICGPDAVLPVFRVLNIRKLTGMPHAKQNSGTLRLAGKSGRIFP